jgi:Ser/Thr protein kinase RdoA (MazF antagonist)
MIYSGSTTEDLITRFVQEKGWIFNPREVRFLAAGEYNENYLVETEKGKFVFRINHGSQLDLDRQTEYEFRVLEAIAPSGVTPKPCIYDQEPEKFSGGVMLMEFLPGRKLDYGAESDLAAEVFARIHDATGDGAYPGLLRQPTPIRDIAAESLGLIERFPDHPLEKERRLLKNYHAKILSLSGEFDGRFESGPQCIVNTEVNSGNFLVDGGTAYLVDWEKAVVSTPFQDLGHFLVETSTRWKDSYVFSPEEKRDFLTAYAGSSKRSPVTGMEWTIDEMIENTEVMERTILLRALSWCFMAWYEYRHTDRSLQDPVTEDRISTYLEEIEWFLG